VPVEFHEEDYKLKEWNKEALTEVFTSLEFKTMAKRILGETLELPNEKPKPNAQPAQMDLFGNYVETAENSNVSKIENNT
jgi:DNA polymerase-1